MFGRENPLKKAGHAPSIIFGCRLVNLALAPSPEHFDGLFHPLRLFHKELQKFALVLIDWLMLLSQTKGRRNQLFSIILCKWTIIKFQNHQIQYWKLLTCTLKLLSQSFSSPMSTSIKAGRTNGLCTKIMIRSSNFLSCFQRVWHFQFTCKILPFPSQNHISCLRYSSPWLFQTSVFLWVHVYCRFI